MQKQVAGMLLKERVSLCRLGSEGDLAWAYNLVVLVGLRPLISLLLFQSSMPSYPSLHLAPLSLVLAAPAGVRSRGSSVLCHLLATCVAFLPALPSGPR